MQVQSVNPIMTEKLFSVTKSLHNSLDSDGVCFVQPVHPFACSLRLVMMQIHIIHHYIVTAIAVIEKLRTYI